LYYLAMKGRLSIRHSEAARRRGRHGWVKGSCDRASESIEVSSGPGGPAVPVAGVSVVQYPQAGRLPERHQVGVATNAYVLW